MPGKDIKNGKTRCRNKRSRRTFRRRISSVSERRKQTRFASDRRRNFASVGRIITSVRRQRSASVRRRFFASAKRTAVTKTERLRRTPARASCAPRIRGKIRRSAAETFRRLRTEQRRLLRLCRGGSRCRSRFGHSAGEQGKQYLLVMSGLRRIFFTGKRQTERLLQSVQQFVKQQAVRCSVPDSVVGRSYRNKKQTFGSIFARLYH